MGNFSRDTFDKLKHYVSVRLQQGVPLVDADWNEQEDIRKNEVETFLKWFVGNGVPKGNDGFKILAIAGNNDFEIQGGDGTAEGAGRVLVEGWDALIESNMKYTEQPLYDNAALATEWGVDPAQPLTTPSSGQRIDTVYLDVWEREVDSNDDFDHLVNPNIGIETCVRLKREWVVRVAEDSANVPASPTGHVFYVLATLNRVNGQPVIDTLQILDVRQTDLNLTALHVEIIDARGDKNTLGERLDESLTNAGELMTDVVGNDQVKTDAAIEESKILFNLAGHNHSGGSNGQLIGTSGLADNAVTLSKLNLQTVNNGSVADIAPDSSRLVLVEADIALAKGKTKVYMPVISITDVEGAGIAQITRQLIYRSTQNADNFDVYLQITNLPGGTETVDVNWYVYSFAEEE
ncbi:MAG: DUF6519 domain-containing protein [Verrucomicrobia bacterium]|nr:DUF6519 domain-containing protein [Verrucomicrobiota bacterium]